MMIHDNVRICWVLLFGLLVCGCNRDPRLAGQKVRSATVKTVTHYDVTLDENATPKQVAYVLLRAIRDDFRATTPEEREAALDTQFDICAANVIAAKNPMALNRDEFIHNTVYRWTPTVSHYVDDFETDWERAAGRFVVSIRSSLEGTNGDTARRDVLMELNDPSGDPNARAVMIIHLAKDDGFWRVVHLGFDAARRTIGN